ncbi:hypothetical protein [Alloactinosynnema sp. L-07]|uniref:hypothetical protein n=1 Tax=Alloactinosynnema sp. L-07 TaxID=1653480 RepID=UPI0012FB658B|nr:hypothetical protein [Alloactinosynnema sp. L-07]
MGGPEDGVDEHPEAQGIYLPAKYRYSMIGPEDLHRFRLLWALGGIVALLIMLSLAGVFVLAILGASAVSFIDVVGKLCALLAPVISAAVGFMVGRQRKRGDR